MNIRAELSHILRNLVDELDVPSSKYQDAQDHYNAVGDWLHNDPLLKNRNPQIYPQGSFALGTVIRPLQDQEYDVDAVCRMEFSHSEITQEKLKDLVGNRLKAHETYAEMLDSQDGHRRCWRLNYSDGSQFHLDILPAIPDNPITFTDIGVPVIYAKHAICITDKDTWHAGEGWPRSNPTGYVLWFKERMRVILQERRQALAMEKQAKVEEIKDIEVRTPLQRVIQLLKRHRDIKFGDDENRPISVIISTLAAIAYNNESDVEETLFNIVPKMRNSIRKLNNKWWIPNPVNPGENFADKWEHSPRKAVLFLDWLTQIENECKELLTPDGFNKVGEYLTEAYGAREASAAMTKYANESKSQQLTKYASTGSFLNESALELTTFDVPQRRNPIWPLLNGEIVTISACSRKFGNWRPLPNNGRYIFRGSELKFTATTTVHPPYEVYWQVVNTGKYARKENNLRGEFFLPRDGSDSLIHTEQAKYRGRHWIKCFIVKQTICVAASEEFVVNIL